MLFGGGADVCAFALFADEAEELHGSCAGGSEPVRGAGVELGGLAGFDLTGVRLDDGQVVAVDVVVVSPQMATRAEPFAGIGITPTSHPAGAFIQTDQFGATSVPGVWAAGNSSDLAAQVSAAAADGARAAQHINADLVMKDLERAVAALADAPTNLADAQINERDAR